MILEGTIHCSAPECKTSQHVGATTMAAAFMSIRRGVTAGKMPTFEASRSEETSHADIAWATMHALLHEPLAGANGTNTGSMEFF